MGRKGSSSSNAKARTPGSPGPAARRIIADEDDSLVLSSKSDDQGSVGKSGGVGVGVTRPKRRLSSPPTLPSPSLQSHSALASSSPPGTPPNGYASSSYQALHNRNLSGLARQNSWPTKSDDKGYFGEPLVTKEPKEPGAPSLFGIELKWISLITLALQNAFLTIIMHYSRISTPPNRTYSAASAVLLNELLKGSISVIIALRRIDSDFIAPSATPLSEKDNRDAQFGDNSRLPSLFRQSRLKRLSKEVFSSDCYKLSIPAILYVIQNNLQYVAASNLDVATFQVTYQMKILTTAFFSVLLLRKRLSRVKWFALIMLAVGVGIVQIQSTSAPAASANGVKLEKGAGSLRSEITIPEEVAPRVMHPLRGFLAVTMACMTSGLAGVYFELILKSSSSGTNAAPDLWVRNTQLSLFSLVPALVPILFAEGGPEGANYFGRVLSKFSNFNGWAIGTVLTQTFGGLITAVVIRYSDNIMKGFATSLSIIISFLASVALFSYPITAAFVIGSSIVLAATYLYNSPASAASSTRTTIAVAGSPITQSAPILGEPEPPSRTSSVISILGLGSASSSRRPSTTDLRGQGGSLASLGFTQVSASSSPNGKHVNPSSIPGTPYSLSQKPSTSDFHDRSGSVER